MEELLALLAQLNEILKKHAAAFRAFTHILDEEEKAISEYSLSALESAVIAKDQHAYISQVLDSNRTQTIKKIFYLIAYNHRNEKISISVFKEAFSIYVKNVKSLINEEIYQRLLQEQISFHEIAHEFEEVFKIVSPRIYRNQMILKKMIKHINFSIHLFQSESDAAMNYDALGKVQSKISQRSNVSLIRIKA